MAVRKYLVVLFGVFTAVLGAARGADLASSVAPQWPHEQSDLVPSPRVKWGRLENGLRFAILPNSTPEKRVSLRLLVQVGSLLERDDQRGYAHFLEHMAFNGTRRFPAGELIPFLQDAGMSFGGHANASTGFTRTLYMLEMPDNRSEQVDTGLRILRDFADGVLLDSAEVEKERGIILSESLARESNSRDSFEAMRQFFYNGTLLGDRPPIGTEESIKAASSTSLRAFYDTWYRPERMVVVIVGDIDPSQAEQCIREHFASLQPRTPPPTPPALGALVEHSGPVAKYLEQPTASTRAILAVTFAEDNPAETSASRLRELHLNAAMDMLGKRLHHLRESTDGPLAGGSVSYQNTTFPGLASFTMTLNATTSEWKELIAIGEQELRKAIEFGFDASELDTFRESMRRSAEALAKSAATTPSAALATHLCDRIHQNRVFQMADEILASRLAELEKLRPETCAQALEHIWGRSPPKIFVAGKDSGSRAEEKILAAYKESQEKAVAPHAALAPVEFAYQDFGPAGEIATREHHEDTDVWVVRFVNGVQLNLKRTAFADNNALFSMRLGTGRVDEPKPGLFLWCSNFTAGGLGRHTREELQRALKGQRVAFSVTAEEESFEFRGSWRTDEFPTGLRVVTAYLSDPGFRADADLKVKNALKRMYGARQTTAQGPLSQTVLPFLAGGDHRFGVPPPNQALSLSMRDLQKWLAPTLREGSIDIGIVGDIDVEATIAEVAKTFGTLPPRAKKPALSSKTKLKLPTPPAEKRLSFPGTKRPTTLALYWPVRDSASFPQRVHFQLLTAVLSNRLREQIREELGEAYTPRAGVSLSRLYSGYGHINCHVSITPDREADVLASLRQLVARLAGDGVTAEELARVKSQAKNSLRQRSTTNAFWIEAVTLAEERPERLDELTALTAQIEATSKPDLDALAARYLVPENLFLFTLEPKPPKK